MDAAALASRLDVIAAGLVREKARLGRSDELLAWIDASNLVKVARAVRDDVELGLDWLENLTVAELGDSAGALLFTYFLRSRSGKARLILRVSVKPPAADREAELASVDPIWPMAWPMEAEAAELFGVNFKGRRTEAEVGFAGSRSQDWHGYPMRRSYVFPREMCGIAHERAPTPKPADGSGLPVAPPVEGSVT